MYSTLKRRGGHGGGGSDVRDKSRPSSSSQPGEPSVNRFLGLPSHTKKNHSWVSTPAELTPLWKVSAADFNQRGPLSWSFKCTALILRRERPCLHRNPRTKVIQRRRLCVEGALRAARACFVCKYNIGFFLKNAGFPRKCRRLIWKVRVFDVLSWLGYLCRPSL